MDEGIVIDFTDGDSYAAVLGALEGWTVQLTDRAGAKSPLYVIRSADTHHGLLVCDAEEDGSPAPGEDARHWLDFDEIARVTIL